MPITPQRMRQLEMARSRWSGGRAEGHLAALAEAMVAVRRATYRCDPDPVRATLALLAALRGSPLLTRHGPRLGHEEVLAWLEERAKATPPPSGDELLLELGWLRRLLRAQPPRASR